jgi:hypothetical protein
MWRSISVRSSAISSGGTMLRWSSRTGELWQALDHRNRMKIHAVNPPTSTEWKWLLKTIIIASLQLYSQLHWEHKRLNSLQKYNAAMLCWYRGARLAMAQWFSFTYLQSVLCNKPITRTITRSIGKVAGATATAQDLNASLHTNTSNRRHLA